jgi:hypothetical protein
MVRKNDLMQYRNTLVGDDVLYTDLVYLHQKLLEDLQKKYG